MKQLLLTLLLVGMIGFLQSQSDYNRNIDFIKNQNQWHENVKYKCQLVDGFVFLEDQKFTYTFFKAEDIMMKHEIQHASEEEQDAFQLHGHSWRLEFLNSLEPVLSGFDVRTYYHNYFIGDASKWASHVPIYNGVKYEGMYSGVDLMAYSQDGFFKTDWIVSIGADPSQIAFSYEGIDEYSLIDGDISLSTSIGMVRESEPIAYQFISGVKVYVNCQYIINDGIVRFDFPNGYDETVELVIDPTLIASTLSGSSGSSNYGHTATFDNEGNIYTGCISFESVYPTTTGAFAVNYNGGFTDCGISKLTPDGSDLVWASFLGGNDGENPHSMITNGNQELYVYGTTSSTDFATTATTYQGSSGGNTDIFVSHFSADGSALLGSTYLGGSDVDGTNSNGVNYGDSYRGEIILDFQDKPIITSGSSSTNFPTTGGAIQSTNSGAQDAVICRLNSTLSNLEMSTYLGSSEGDMGYGVRAASDGSYYVAGSAGDGFTVTAGVYQSGFAGGGGGWSGNAVDGFICRINSSGTTLLASTYLGTSSDDQIFFIDLDTDENVFVFGQGGVDMPVTDNVYINPNSEQFITKLDADLTEVLVGTVIGSGNGGGDFGSTDFVPDAFLVDNCNNIYISGYSAFGTLETTADALFTDGGFYLAVYSENIEDLEYGTMYTGDHVDGGTSRFDKNGTVYQAVCSGGGFSTTSDAWATDQSTGWDIGVFKINFDVSGVNASVGGSDINGCAPFVTTFENYSTGDQFLWDLGDGTTSTEFEPTHTYSDPGVYTITLIVSDSLSCNLADTSSFEINISTPMDYTPSFTFELGCNDLSATCTNSTDIDFLQYIWDFGDGTVVEDYDGFHIYDEPGEYVIELTAIDNGCVNADSISTTVNVLGEVVAALGNANLEGCSPFLAEFDNQSAGSVYTWDFGDGTPSESGQEITHLYTEPGIYDVLLLVEGLGNCDGADTTTATVTVIEPQVESAFSIDQIQGCEEMLIQTNNLSSGVGITYSWDFGDGGSSTEENPSYNYTEPGTYVVVLSIFDDVCESNFSSEQVVDVISAGAFEIDDVPFCYHWSETTVNGNVVPNITGYLWSTNETTEVATVTSPGIYTVTAFINNCWLTDEFEVYEVARINLMDSIELCDDASIMLRVPYEGATSQEWCNGEMSENQSVSVEGEYCYTFDDSFGCHQEGVFYVADSEEFSNVFIPNSFSPNEDGINDLFKPVVTNLSSYELTIYDRVGNDLFYSEDASESWNGQYLDEENYYIPTGVYTYRIKYKSASVCDLESTEKYGVITVVR